MSDTIESGSDIASRAARALSKALCGGAAYRLEIGAAIWATAVVNTAELAEQLGLARQSVNKELQILEDAGLLARPEGQEGRKVFLVRQDSSYWTWCREATANAAAMLERKERF